jgi:hypothetical protein
LFGVEFWLTTLVFFLIQFGKKTTYLIFFLPFQKLVTPNFVGVEFWLTTTLIYVFKINLEKTTYLIFFLPYLKLVTPNFVGIQFW